MSSATQDQNLDALVAKLAEGDRSAFTPAFQLLWTPTLRLCTRLLKNGADAADAAQQAMQKILERRRVRSRPSCSTLGPGDRRLGVPHDPSQAFSSARGGRGPRTRAGGRRARSRRGATHA